MTSWIISNIKTQVSKGNSISEFVIIGLLIVICICLLPIYLVVSFFGIVINFIYPKKNTYDKSKWYNISTGTNLILRYKQVDVGNMAEYIIEYFDINQLVLFEAEPQIDFLKGHFTNFIVERKDGIFIQKVIHNPEVGVIDSLPLYFFNYLTHEFEEIGDFKEFDLEARGNPDDFVIEAYGKEEIIRINVK